MRKSSGRATKAVIGKADIQISSSLTSQVDNCCPFSTNLNPQVLVTVGVLISVALYPVISRTKQVVMIRGRLCIN
jgi:hypothetical protein